METKSLNCAFWLHVACAYLTIGLMGLTQLAELVAFPLLRDYFSPTADQYGLVTSILGGCYLLGCFLSSLILKKWGFKTLYVIAYLTDITGCILLQFARSFFWASACLFFISTSQGLFEISTNAVATSLFKKHTATWMMFMQTCFGIGATLSPILCKWSVHLLNRNFYSCYIMVATLVSLGFIFICFIDINPARCYESEEKSVDVVVDDPAIPQDVSVVQEVTANEMMHTEVNTNELTHTEATANELTHTEVNTNNSYSWWTTLSTPMCWLCAVTMGMMEGMENGTNSWATLYLVDILHFDPLKEVATFATFLQLIFTISRLISGPLIDWVGYYSSLYISNIGCMLLLLIGFLTGRNGIYFFVFTSFFYAWFWPTNVCVMMGIFKENAPYATSHIFVMQGLFTFPFGYILGWVNRLCGDQWAYRANLLFGTIALICLTAEYCISKKKEESVKVALISEEKEIAVPIA